VLRERLIVDDSLVAGQNGYSLRARLPWYRALPLSCLAEVDLAVDGEPADPTAVTVETDGFQVPLTEVAQASDRSWYVLDDLVLHVSGAGLADRPRHQVHLTVGLRIPYLPVNGAPLIVREHATKTMPAEELVA
jgi:hypothetical protein